VHAFVSEAKVLETEPSLEASVSTLGDLLHHVDPAVRAGYAHVLEGLGEDARESALDLIEALSQSAVARRLTQPGPGDVPLWLTDAALNPNGPAAYKAFDALVDLGPEDERLVLKLIVGLESPDFGVRWRAVNLLEEMESKAEPAHGALARLLNDEVTKARELFLARRHPRPSRVRAGAHRSETRADVAPAGQVVLSRRSGNPDLVEAYHTEMRTYEEVATQMRAISEYTIRDFHPTVQVEGKRVPYLDRQRLDVVLRFLTGKALVMDTYWYEPNAHDLTDEKNKHAEGKHRLQYLTQSPVIIPGHWGRRLALRHASQGQPSDSFERFEDGHRVFQIRLCRRSSSDAEPREQVGSRG